MARQMKDSGIEWIGAIPANWKLQKGKFLYRQRSEKGNSVELQLLSPTQKYGVIPQSLYEKISGMKPVQLDAKADLEQFKSIYTGDFCISLRSFQGGFEYSQYNGVVSPAYQVFYRQTDTTSDAFYRYIFKEMGFIGYMNSFTKSFRDGKSIAFDDFAGTLLPVPPIEEQNSIASFLDRKCAEIDAVIQRTKATIEEYKKLKQAVITEAVTKGVRGARKMKDSGIEWIEEIPEEWSMRKLKSFSCIISKGATPKDIAKEVGSSYPIRFLKSENIVDNQLTLNPEFYISSDVHNGELKRSALSCDDILFVIAGASIGKVALMDAALLPANTNQAVSFVRVSKEYVNVKRFIWYVLQSKIMKTYISLFAVQSAQPNMSMEDLGDFRMPFTQSNDEITEITLYLDRQCSELDTLITKKTALLTELETYKKSLIYEYVTGKKEVV